MLAHRAVMFLALSQTPGAGDVSALAAAAAETLGEYRRGIRFLLEGDREQGVRPPKSERVRLLLMSPGHTGHTGATELQSFGARGERCLERLRSGDTQLGGEVRLLADKAGEVLLPLLNAVVAALEADLADAEP
jgi:hypothetical protein